MAKLDAAERREIPKSEFGEPGQKKYPMPDKSHAADAKDRAKQMLNKGKLSQSAFEKVVAKADKVLDEK